MQELFTNITVCFLKPSPGIDVQRNLCGFLELRGKSVSRQNCNILPVLFGIDFISEEEEWKSIKY